MAAYCLGLRCTLEHDWWGDSGGLRCLNDDSKWDGRSIDRGFGAKIRLKLSSVNSSSHINVDLDEASSASQVAGYRLLS